jgi:hypothetical protein
MYMDPGVVDEEILSPPDKKTFQIYERIKISQLGFYGLYTLLYYSLY